MFINTFNQLNKADILNYLLIYHACTVNALIIK
jgi:hypothetical protein